MTPDFRAPSTQGVRQALLAAIYGTESPDYNVMYGGQRFDDYSQHPNRPVLIESGPNKGKYSTAAGKPQFLKSTWDELQRELELPDFSPSSQDQAAWHLADKTYRQKTGGYLEDVLASRDPQAIAGVGQALSGKWTSLPGGIEQNTNENKFVQAFNDARGLPGAETQMAQMNYTIVEPKTAGGEFTIVEPKTVQGDPSRWGMFPEAMDTLTMGGASKLNAAGGAVIDASLGALQGKEWNYSEPYNRQLEQQRADQSAYQEQNPNKSMGGKAAGVGLGITSLPFAKGFTGAVKSGAGYGVLGGALQDADSKEQRAWNTVAGAGTGALLGSAVYPVASLLGKGVNAVRGVKSTPAPTTEQLRSNKNALYDAAEGGVGKVRMTRTHMTQLAQRFNNVGKDTNMGGVLQSVTNDAYKATNSTISKFNQIASDVNAGRVPPPTFGELEKMRQNLNATITDSVTPQGKLTSDGTMSLRVLEEIDDFLMSSPFQEARTAYRTLIKAERIERAFRFAELNAGANYTQAGMEKAIQGQFNRIAQHKSFQSLFTKEEQSLIEGVVKGGTPVQRLMKRFGALAPKGGLSTMFNIGMVSANPLLGIPLGVAAAGSKMGSTAKTLKSARQVDEMVRRGGLLAGPKPKISDQMNRLLMPPAGLLGSDYLRSP